MIARAFHGQNTANSCKMRYLSRIRRPAHHSQCFSLVRVRMHARNRAKIGAQREGDSLPAELMRQLLHPASEKPALHIGDIDRRHVAARRSDALES